MNKLILFDIDGTLISGAHGHIEAFAVAFKEVYGVDASIFMINPNGMTDQNIILEVLKKAGLTTEEIESKMHACMVAMVKYFQAIQGQLNVQVFPGVKELLTEFENRGYLMGLVTGNLEPIARGKMGIAGINSHFKVGGFGSDARERSDLVVLAIKQAKAKYQLEEGSGVYLFGDAPQDMMAAVKGGANPIGVTTGIYSAEALDKAGAKAVLAGLTDTTNIVKQLI